MKKEKIVGIIPARLGSERMPGKVLYRVKGKTILQHTYDRAARIKSLDEVYIATDSEKIVQAAGEFGAKTIMTSSRVRNGSERAAEAAAKLSASIIVDIQADEPFFPREAVDAPLAAMKRDKTIVCATPVAKITKKEELYDTNIVKTAMALNGDALYFSRSLIPYPVGYFEEGRVVQSRKIIFYKHIGVYVFRKPFLLKYARLAETYLEKTEKLEQLRIMEHGYPVKVVIISRDSPCVDTVEDLARLEKT